MLFWKQTRTYFLVITFIGIVLILLKSLFTPTKEQPKITTFIFPSKVSLPGWQFHSIVPQKDKKERVYLYNHNGIKLQIKMRYEDDFIANEAIFRQYNPVVISPEPLNFIIRQKDKIGAYRLSIDQGYAYLHSCINPNGPSAITYEQFRHNRLTSDWQLHRLLPVLLEQQQLRDSRCFWTHLSIPIQNSSPESTYQILESAWFSWFPYWHSRFP